MFGTPKMMVPTGQIGPVPTQPPVLMQCLIAVAEELERTMLSLTELDARLSMVCQPENGAEPVRDFTTSGPRAVHMVQAIGERASDINRRIRSLLDRLEA